MRIFKLLTLVFVLSVGVFSTATAQSMAKHTMDKTEVNDNVTVIELTQTDGKFLNSDLNLKPGKYQFRVVNKDVAKEVGFIIQAKSDANGDPMKTALPTSFAKSMIKTGTAEYTGIVELKAGEYVYSCPINPTPKYNITVK